VPIKPLLSKGSKMMKRIALAAALCTLAGCAAPQQTATPIPPSSTGCYYRVPGYTVTFLAFPIATMQQPRYEPAPCNLVNANQPVVIRQGGGGGTNDAPQTLEAPSLAVPVISPPDTSACIGAVVNGICHGTPAPGAPMATCHGQMVGGVCTGPMF
jgi:hypothetical protein